MFIPASSEMHATEQPVSGRQQWTALHECILTLALARTIPQIDRISRNDALNAMQKLSPGPLPTDADATFKWWMLVSNLGEHTIEIIGRGIVSAELADKSGNAS